MSFWDGYITALATILAIDLVWFACMVIQVHRHDHKHKH
jgi:hypothetical protein